MKQKAASSSKEIMMNDKDRDIQFIKRCTELAERADRSFAYTYTSFHSMQTAMLSYKVTGEEKIKLWGGADGCERVIVRFGDPQEIREDEDFPISVIFVTPTQLKFAEMLTHRDYLGAILNLGIERDVTGDIFVRDDGAYVFALSEMADYIAANLDRVKHTSVRCSIVDEVPADCLPKLTEEAVTVSSPRLDAVIAKVWHLSRGDAKDLFDAEKVSINGRICKNPEATPSENSSISVRGYGRFEYAGEECETKKGKVRVAIKRYV